MDIIAPGSGILGACSDLSFPECVDGEWYVPYSGTSMSSPHVAGVVALYMNYLTDDDENPSPSPDDVKRALACTSSNNYINGVPANTPNRMVYIPQDDFDQAILDCIKDEQPERA